MVSILDTDVAQSGLHCLAPGFRPALRELAAEIATLANELAESELPAAVGTALQPHLGQPDLLDPRHMRGAADSYRRHLLYADPLRRFSILALVWAPGQHTPVHGHTAWGAVGMHQGRLEARSYELLDAGEGLWTCAERERFEAGPGATSWVQPGLRDIHRLACAGSQPAISIHVYGRDLSEDPGSINITLPH
jgi:predicted metal-dependent enzyme (double-stranded beta helix superfamily)